MPKSIHCYAPAKINLTLDIKSKKDRSAPFHTIETIYHRIRLVDEITITQSDQFEIVGDFDCAMEDNLIFKAFDLIRSYHPKAPQVKVEVLKNIPPGSGLGGGSSNFATFTKLYFRLFELGDITEDLINQAGHIGKDIPFFFQPASCAFGLHFGEVIKPLNFNFSGETLYLYQPSFRNDSGEAYQSLKNFDTTFTQDFLNPPPNPLPYQGEGLDFLIKKCGNTFDQLLQNQSYQSLPLTREHWRGLHLTGSGSVFYSFTDLGMIKGCEKIETHLL